MSEDDFKVKREKFSEDIGAPGLYKFIDHFGLYAGAHTIFNKLWTYELLLQTRGIPGDIAEFGCWNGSNLMFLAKVINLIEPNSPKKIFGFDNFSGLPATSAEDGIFAGEQVGKYMGNELVLRKAIELFDLQNRVELVVGDALETIPNFLAEKQQSLISFAYLDFDLYEPTKAALDFLEGTISVGGVIVFDQALTENWPGETLAMKEFLCRTKHEFLSVSNTVSRQPTIALKRLK